MPLPLLALAASAASSFFGGAAPAPAGPSSASGNVFAPGGLTVGSKVVGSGSAATSVQPPPVPGDMTATNVSAVPGSATVSTTTGVPSLLKNPLVWIIGGAGIVLLFLLGSSRDK